ncbi:MAG TPA: pitrilysin family protein [candidate division Zixibacteria bacterium]|nr:pitrilysin family protein [candidate division Zixibacteria bacterium]
MTRALERVIATVGITALLCGAAVSDAEVTPRVEKRTLQSGMRVVLLENNELPLLQIRLLAEAGSIFDPDERSGVAAVTVKALLAGAGERNAVQLQRHIDSLGATVWTEISRERSQINGVFHSRDALSALRLIYDLVAAPQLTDAELENYIRRQKSAVFQLYDLGRPIMDDAAYELFFPGLPWGRLPYGEPDELSDITPGDVRAFQQKYYSPERLKLVIAGDFDSRRLMTDVATVFMAQSRGERESPPAPVAPEPSERLRIVLLDEPGSPSAWVGFYALGAPFSSAHQQAAQRMLGHLLGGEPELSYIGRKLIEERSLISRLESATPFQKLWGLLQLEMSCPRENVVDVIAETLDELRLMSETRISKRELEDGKRFFRGYYALGFETAGSGATRLAEALAGGEAHNYHDSLLQAINTLTPDDLMKVAADLFANDRLAVVVYGDADRFERSLNEFGLVLRKRTGERGE